MFLSFYFLGGDNLGPLRRQCWGARLWWRAIPCGGRTRLGAFGWDFAYKFDQLASCAAPLAEVPSTPGRLRSEFDVAVELHAALIVKFRARRADLLVGVAGYVLIRIIDQPRVLLPDRIESEGAPSEGRTTELRAGRHGFTGVAAHAARG